MYFYKIIRFHNDYIFQKEKKKKKKKKQLLFYILFGGVSLVHFYLKWDGHPLPELIALEKIRKSELLFVFVCFFFLFLYLGTFP